eukprot:gene7529-7041_t
MTLAALEAPALEVKRWLTDHGLEDVEGILFAHDFKTLRDVCLITEQDVLDLGVTRVGTRRRLLNAVRDLNKSFNPFDTAKHAKPALNPYYIAYLKVRDQ